MTCKPAQIVVAIATIIILLAWQSNVYAANSITLRCDKTRMTINDLLSCEVVQTITDDDDVGDVSQPTFTPFKVLQSNTSRSSSTQIINFKMSSSSTNTTTFMLQPTKVGNFTLGPASYVQKGKTYQSNTIKITVIDVDVTPNTLATGKDAISAPLTDAEMLTPQLFLRMIPERGEMFVGEQTAVTLYLYVADIAVSRWSPDTPSSFSGFRADHLEMNQQGEVQRIIINRRNYHVQAMDRYLITALQPGENVIGSYRGRALVGDRFMGGNWRGIASQPVRIVVRDLPTEGRPNGFRTDNVGSFNLSARLDRRRTEVGQPVTLTIYLRGDKALDRVAIPQLPTIEGAKVYPPTETKDEAQRGLKIQGTRSAEYLIVPNREGVLKIPEISLPVFDTVSGSYKTLQTRKFNIKVTKATGPAASIDSQAAKQRLEISADALRPLKPSAELTNHNGKFFGTTLFLGLFWGPLAILLLIWIVDGGRYVFSRIAGNERQLMEKKMKQLAVSLTASASSPTPVFYSDLAIWLIMVSGKKLDESATGMTHAQLRNRLLDQGVSEEDGDELVLMLEACDQARYAPGAAPDGTKLWKQARDWAGRLA